MTVRSPHHYHRARLTVPVRSLDDFRRTRLLFIDTATLHHLNRLDLHYGAGLLEVGRQSQHVLTARDGKFIPAGHYTVRIQDDRFIRDIEIVIDEAGEVTEGASITIFSQDEADADKAEFERQLDEIDEAHSSAEFERLFNELDKNTPSNNRTLN